MGRIWKGLIILAGAALFISILLFFLIKFTPQPPVSEMQQARKAMSIAARNKADTYSKKQYRDARACYNSALEAWKKENARFLYFRDYEKVVKLARLAAKKAAQSADSSKVSSATLQTKTAQKIRALNELVSNINDRFTTYPLSMDSRNRISKGEMLLSESEIISKKGLFTEADKKLTESEYLLTTAYETASESLKNYFRSYPDWKKWANKTIADSKDSGNYSIIVDKFSRKLMVFLGGKKKLEYSAELGRNWAGEKKVRGDHATPEGMYRITEKFDSNKTKYYKALLLNYPNYEDTAKFKEMVAKGILPKNAKIGGMIEIHGNGGKGVDWTEGCIAVTDDDMDDIFKIAKVGTPVTIVGSMYDLQSVLKK